MPVYIVKPVLTDDIIIRIYEHMVMCEIMKIFGHMPQHHDGLQDGYFKCLVDLFADEPNTSAEIQHVGHRKGKTYLRLVDEIIEAKLQPTIEYFLQVCSEEGRDFGSLMDQLRVEGDTRKAVREFFDIHARDMRATLRF